MDRDAAARLAAALAAPAVRAEALGDLDALRAALGGPAPPVAAGRWGGAVGYAPEPGRRRLIEVDRDGQLVAALAWAPDGALHRAKCRAAGGAWIGLEPRATAHPAWGASDRLWTLAPGAAWAPGAPLTVFQALDYGRPAFIPPLWEPARLPPGAGTAVLNVLAGLMVDQGVPRVRYRGPYPTELLFTSLLECFRCEPAAGALDRFLGGDAVDWRPAPHERFRPAPRVTVQGREELEKVVLGEQAFYRADWQGIVRHEPYRLRRDGPRHVCSLWALEQPLEDRLVLDARGEVLHAPPPVPDPRPAAPLPPVWPAALAEVIARESAPPLAPALGQVLGAVRLAWGPAPGDLLRVDGDAVTLSRRLRDVGWAWVAEAPPGPERAARAVRVVLEVARLLAPLARRRAQAVVAALPEPEQARLLGRTAAPPLGESVARLVALVAAGGG